MPASPEELDYHNLLLNEDPQASALICDRYLDEITRRLAKNNTPIDPHIITEAVIDALLDYTAHPDRYKPDLKSLANYLYMAASGDMRNKLKSIKGRNQKELPLDFFVGNDLELGNGLIDEINRESKGDPDYLELRQRIMDNGKDPQEQEIIGLMLENEKDYLPYAQILGLEDKTVDEQRIEVNKVKEKLRLRIKRGLEKVRNA